MSLLTIIGIAIGLAMDALAVAIAVGTRLPRLTYRHYFRLSFHFGLFQALMPIAGWFLGRTVERYISAFDHWVAFALLVAIGAKMLYESFQHKRDVEKVLSDPTRKWSLILLSVATSIDAFAVGLSMALLNIGIALPATIIGVVALLATAIGMRCGRSLGERIGSKAEFIGGLILIGIGLKIVLSH